MFGLTYVDTTSGDLVTIVCSLIGKDNMAQLNRLKQNQK